MNGHTRAQQLGFTRSWTMHPAKLQVCLYGRFRLRSGWPGAAVDPQCVVCPLGWVYGQRKVVSQRLKHEKNKEKHNVSVLLIVCLKLSQVEWCFFVQYFLRSCWHAVEQSSGLKDLAFGTHENPWASLRHVSFGSELTPQLKTFFWLSMIAARKIMERIFHIQGHKRTP